MTARGVSWTLGVLLLLSLSASFVRATSAPEATCGRFPVTVSTTCSGHGDCLNGTCVCHEGWSGNGDWTRSIGYDCQINEAAVKALYGLNFVAHFLVLLWGAPRVRRAYHKFEDRRKERLRVGERVSISENRAMVSHLVHIFITVPSMLILDVVEMATPQRVGVDVGATVVFVLMRTSVYLQAFLIQPFLLSALLGRRWGGNTTKVMLRTSDRFAFAIFIVLGGAGFLAFVTLATKDPDTTVYLYIVYQAMVLVAFFLMLLQARFVDRHTTQILCDSYKIAPSDRILEVKERIHATQKSLMVQSCVQMCVAIVLGGIPVVWNNYSYALPLTFGTAAPLWTKYVRATTEAANKASEADTTNAGSATPPDPSRTGAKKPTKPSLASTTESQTGGVLGPYVEDGALSDFVVQSPFQRPAVLTEIRDGEDIGLQTGESEIQVRVSPAMRMVQMMTPSRMASALSTPSGGSKKPKGFFEG